MSAVESQQIELAKTILDQVFVANLIYISTGKKDYKKAISEMQDMAAVLLADVWDNPVPEDADTDN